MCDRRIASSECERRSHSRSHALLLHLSLIRGRTQPGHGLIRRGGAASLVEQDLDHGLEMLLVERLAEHQRLAETGGQAFAAIAGDERERDVAPRQREGELVGRAAGEIGVEQRGVAVRFGDEPFRLLQGSCRASYHAADRGEAVLDVHGDERLVFDDDDPLSRERRDRKSTRLNSSHGYISYAVFCLKKKKTKYVTDNVYNHKDNLY